MIAGLHIGSELRRLRRGVLPPVGFVVICLLPLIFGGLFPWAYFDPVGGLSRMPVAVVNSDRGGTLGGEPFNAGDLVADELEKNDDVNFIPVSADEARRGVADGTYYLAIELPEDFSDAATSIRGENPQSATINVQLNNNNGFIASTLGNQVSTTVVNTVDQQLGEQVTNQLLLGYSTVKDGMSTARDGAGTLHDGTSSARTGAEDLTSGAATLEEGLATAEQGTQRLREGASTLDAGLAKAEEASAQLADGLSQLDAVTNRVGQGADNLQAAFDQAVAPLVNASAALRSSGLPGAPQLVDQIDAALHGVRTESQAAQLRDALGAYRAGMNTATAGAHALNEGLVQLKDGSSALVVGVNAVADGSSKLSAGATQLRTGAAALRDGLVTLDDGSGELAFKLGEGTDAVPTWEGQRLNDASAVGGQPAHRELTGDGLTKFGVGLAPFFLSLAMFIGGIMMFFVLNPLQRRALDSGVSPLRAVLASYLPAIVVGTLQATIVWAVITGLVGLDPARPGLLWAALVGVSWTFVAVVQAINAAVGATAGRVVAIAFMALQLVSSGGLYPPETQPAFLRWFNTYDPMTYSVNIFRQAIIGPGQGDPRLQQGVIVLACVWVGALAVSSLAAWAKRVIARKDLHPELAI